MRLPWWLQSIDLARTNDWFGTPPVDERLGVCDGAREREHETDTERERHGEWVSELELLFPPNPSYWTLAVGIHHSPPLCDSGIGCKTLIKAHLPTTNRNTVCPERLCDCERRNFSRSINFVVDSYITIWPTIASKASNCTHTHSIYKKMKIKTLHDTEEAVTCNIECASL